MKTNPTAKKSEYDIQAENFLNKTQTTIRKVFIVNKPYFPDDKESRDVYQIIFDRPIKGLFSQWNKWTHIDFTFGQSIANKGKVPTDYDILAGLYTPRFNSFQEFCDAFGYSTDSIRDKETYNKCQELAEKLESFFTPEELKALSEIN